MIKIIDTVSQIDSLFDNETLNNEKWEIYINSIYENSADIFKDDLKEYLESGNYIYEKDILPIINAVYGHESLQMLQTSFYKITDGLNEKIKNCFDNGLDVDIVLYLGLCNGAGWVNSINGRDVILLGIEKILELNWCDEDSMYALIYHELGHVYHKQYGVFEQRSEDNSLNFVWQLFIEGIAMYFEQVLVGDFNYYHQNKNGWLDWCENNFHQILADYYSDLPTMTRFNQRYFGDWVNYCGRCDVGYFLGAKFVQHLCSKVGFEQLIKIGIDEIYQEFCAFAEFYL
ncbi:MAG: hypothetical protein IJA34_01265 [Lachnospiraceae bacterium]|nr:hypothetical protein [Lachnospiraceae bacterium]